MKVLPIERLNEIFDRMSQLKIAVVGDVMLDRYLWGDADRISPEAPVPIVKLERDEVRIGGAANVADNLAVLGIVPRLISVIGNDSAGEAFLEHSRELDLPTDLVIAISERPTTVKTRVIARHQQVCRIDEEDARELSEDESDAIMSRFASIAGEVDAVIISDYGKGVVTKDIVQKIVEHCGNNGRWVTVDPKENHWEYYRGVDLIKPNHHETARATGISTATRVGLERAGRALLDMTGSVTALITTGERGMSLFQNGHSEVKHLETMAREVFDVTGAGDTVIAVATAALACGSSLIEAAIIANHAAGVVVAEVGTAAATREQISESMARETGRLE